jgi:hypothetical protein
MSRPSTLPIPELSQNDSPFWILQFPAVLIAYKLFSLLAEKPLTISSPFFCEFVDLVMNNLPVGPVATSSTPTLAEEFSTIRPGVRIKTAVGDIGGKDFPRPLTCTASIACAEDRKLERGIVEEGWYGNGCTEAERGVETTPYVRGSLEP